ncbi:trichohyalin [Macrosteles quadrilineatus]|uniref:trichohyalin n=1 Tax=Macrosteles quadrilineatus TaxID=74068 RepID=UPI0023E257FC|nr:trichohyalin [Macrosteles quadrilineatus]
MCAAKNSFRRVAKSKKLRKYASLCSDNDILDEKYKFVQRGRSAEQLTRLNSDSVKDDFEDEILFPYDATKRLSQQVEVLLEENGQLRRSLVEAEARLKGVVTKCPPAMATHGRASDLAASKIVELSKRVRELTADLEVAKMRCRTFELSTLTASADPQEKCADIKSEKSSENEMKELTDKLSSANLKVCEYRNQCQQLKHELKLAHKALISEVGEGVSITSIVNGPGGGGWRGRAQQIQTLQQRINELSEKTANPDAADREARKALSAARLVEKELRAELEKEVSALKEQLGEKQKKVEAMKARTRVLETSLSELRGRLSTLLDKSTHDDQLISALTAQLGSLTDKSQERSATNRIEQHNKLLEQQLTEEKSKSIHLQNALVEKDQETIDLLEKIKELQNLGEKDNFEKPRSASSEIAQSTNPTLEALSLAADAERVRLLELLAVTNKRLEQERQLSTQAQDVLRRERHKAARLETKLARHELERASATSRSSYHNPSPSPLPRKPTQSSTLDVLRRERHKAARLETKLARHEIERDVLRRERHKAARLETKLARLELERLQDVLRGERHKAARLETKLARHELERDVLRGERHKAARLETKLARHELERDVLRRERHKAARLETKLARHELERDVLRREKHKAARLETKLARHELERDVLRRERHKAARLETKLARHELERDVLRRERHKAARLETKLARHELERDVLRRERHKAARLETKLARHELERDVLRRERHKAARLETKLARHELERASATGRSSYHNPSPSLDVLRRERHKAARLETKLARHELERDVLRRERHKAARLETKLARHELERDVLRRERHKAARLETKLARHELERDVLRRERHKAARLETKLARHELERDVLRRERHKAARLETKLARHELERDVLRRERHKAARLETKLARHELERDVLRGERHKAARLETKLARNELERDVLRRERHKAARLETKLARHELERASATSRSSYHNPSPSPSKLTENFTEDLKCKIELLEEEVLFLRTRLANVEHEKQEDLRTYTSMLEHSRHAFQDAVRNLSSTTH